MQKIKVLEYIKEEKYLVVKIIKNDIVSKIFQSELSGYRHNFEFYMRFELGLVHNIKLCEDDNYIYLYFKTIKDYQDMCIEEFKKYFNAL